MRRSLTILLPLLLVLAACGGSDDDGDDDAAEADISASVAEAEPEPEAEAGEPEEGGGDAGAASEPCSLLTPADLEAVFGSPFDDGDQTHQDETGADQCVWTNTDAPPVKTLSLVTYVDGKLADPFPDDIDEWWALQKEALEIDEELDLGDEAFRSGTMLWVLDGDVAYNLSTFTGTSDTAIDGMKRLAEQLVG